LFKEELRLSGLRNKLGFSQNYRIGKTRVLFRFYSQNRFLIQFLGLFTQQGHTRVLPIFKLGL
jgi:hypothetical protein